MLKIDRLLIKIPAGFETRASDIVRLISEQLKDYDFSASLDLESLSLPRIQLAHSTTASEVAGKIVQELTQAIDQRAEKGLKPARRYSHG